MLAKWLGCVACLVSTAGASAGAQMPGGASTRPVHLIVSGGLTLPAGDLKDLHDTGFHYDASLLFTFAGMPISLRPELSLTRFSLKSPTGATTSYGSGDVSQMFGALGNIELPIAGGLYLLAGGGLLSLSTPDATGSDVSQSKFAFDAGGGFRFRMGSISGFVEGRIGSASYDAGKVGFAKAQFIPVTFGLVF